MLQRALFVENGHSIKLPIWECGDCSGPFILVLMHATPLLVPSYKERMCIRARTQLCGLARNDGPQNVDASSNILRPE